MAGVDDDMGHWKKEIDTGDGRTVSNTTGFNNKGLGEFQCDQQSGGRLYRIGGIG